MTANPKTLSVLVAALMICGLSACQAEQNQTSTAEKALDKLQQQYDELVAVDVDAPIDWAAEDIENIGDWEYRVEDLEFSSADELAEQLNELGNDRWEVIWLERTPDGYFAVLKKPSISYLSKIPLSQLGRLMIGGSGATE